MTHPNPSYELAANALAELDDGYRFTGRSADADDVAPDADTTIIQGRESIVPPETHFRTPSVIHYPKAREKIIIQSGVNLVEHFLGFDCRAIQIQNLGTNQFLYFPDYAWYVTSAPTQIATFNLPDATQRLSLQWHTALFNALTPAAVPGQIAVAWLYDEWILPTALESSGGGVGTAVTLTGIDAPSALADAQANPTTYRFGADIQIWNGATWDRVREPTADALAVAGIIAAGLVGWNGASWDRLRVTATQDLLVNQRSTIAPAQTSVAQNAASVTILAANANRKMASVQNQTGAGNLFLSYVTPATITGAQFVQLAPGAYFELPLPVATAQLYGIWDAAGTGSARIVEYA